MKSILTTIMFFAFFLVTQNAKAGTCTTISRTDNSSNSVLTSTKYNADHNTAYSAHNSFDGGCVTVGTLEPDSLNTTQFDVVLNAPRAGCELSISDTNTISVNLCKIAVSGNFLNKTSATTVTWGCTGCSSESSSDTFYIFVKNDSTFTLLILSAAPNADGYNGSGDRAIGRFFNDASSDIVAQGDKVGNSYQPFSTVSADTGNGYGSTNTRIRRYSNTPENIGPAITFADSPPNGASFTINEDGIYNIAVTDKPSASTCQLGVSLNSSNLTTDIGSVTIAQGNLGFVEVSTTIGSQFNISLPLLAADIIRAHTNTNCDNATEFARFRITKVSL